MSREVIENLKSYIESRIDTLSRLLIAWFGGEPLLYMDIIQEIGSFCIEICDKNKVLYDSNMTSNGVLLNKKNAKILTQLGIDRIQITLDGWKANHDITRVTKAGGPTFDLIFNNIMNFLDIDDKNKIALRIHIKSDMKEEDTDKVLRTLELFDKRYRERIMVYLHVIYDPCTEKWAKGCSTEDELCPYEQKKEELYNEINEKVLEELTEKITEEALKMGFSTPYIEIKRYRGACEGDGDWGWVLRPDGYLTKCTVAVEKQRAQARLTKNGIEIFPERFLKMRKKEFSSRLREYCSDCKYLPFCWGGCAYKHYQNPDIETFIKELCYKGKRSWMMDRRINIYKNNYMKRKTQNEGR